MKITDLLDEKSILLNGKVDSKKAALDKMVDLMEASGKISDIETYRKGVYAREEESTTGIGEGIAIPHCKSEAVRKPGLAAMVVQGGVDFDSLDGEPADLIFLIAAPNTKDNVHLDVLSRLSVLLMNEDFTGKLRSAKSVEEFKRIIDTAEKEADNEEDATVESSESDVFILAVTGCPTGIAHTYMAAEALEKRAKELGYQVKVETRGSGGAKNVLTADEIERADGIIVAADTKVPLERFRGKRVVITKVADGINKADQLIEQALSGRAPVYEGGTESVQTDSDESEKKGFGHAAYTHLMSGVSHMLPFVIGGGILKAIAFLIDTLSGYGDIGSAFGSATPISALLMYIGGLVMDLMVPVLAGYIAYSIADRPGLAVGFAGGLLAAKGNALLASYAFASEPGGFQKFISNFAFVGENGGNTVSGFLGGIVAGFLAGAIILGLKKLCDKLPDSLDGIKPTLIYPVVGVLIIGVLMCMIFNPVIGLINTGLSHVLVNISDAGMTTLLALLLGAMMAIDMGGPINKAAYVFGTMMLEKAATLPAGSAEANVCYVIMAAIMVGGMVPPVGIAAACKLFSKKFTKEEQGSAVSNIVMGCSFITEGAIPFAASDPLHVIPCTMVGAGVAGLLSALFNCTLMAPHGGVFVFATVGNPLMYVVAWLIGSAVTTALLGVLKKNRA